MGPPYRKWIVCHASSQQPFPIQNIVLIILISHVCRESVTTTVAAAMDYHIHISCDIVFANGGKFLPGCFDRWSIANRTKIFEIKTPNWDGSSEFVPLLNFNESRHFFEFFFFIVKFSYIRSLTTIGRKKKKKTSSFWGRLQSLVVSSATNLLFFQKNSIFISLFATRYKNIFEKKIIQKNSLW